jgi:hypothetical protein
MRSKAKGGGCIGADPAGAAAEKATLLLVPAADSSFVEGSLKTPLPTVRTVTTTSSADAMKRSHEGAGEGIPRGEEALATSENVCFLTPRDEGRRVDFAATAPPFGSEEREETTATSMASSAALDSAGRTAASGFSGGTRSSDLERDEGWGSGADKSAETTAFPLGANAMPAPSTEEEEEEEVIFCSFLAFASVAYSGGGVSWAAGAKVTI